MKEITEFQNERKIVIDGYAEDANFQGLSQAWLRTSMERRYVYNFDCLGRPIIQYPQDMVAIQELIWSTRPDVIIETGIAHGGSLIHSASILALLDLCDANNSGDVLDPQNPKRYVIGIDIDIRPHNRAAIEAHPLSARVKMIEGSSINPAIIDLVSKTIEKGNRVMVCLDSMHTHDHVLAELEAYGPMVSEGCYVVVFDSFVENMPAGFFKNRPWDVGNNPMTAVKDWLKHQPEFQIDSSIDTKLQITAAPNGYLKRVMG